MGRKFVCPWWMGYILANPVRKLFHNPDEILSPYVRTGARILEIGPGMGFFSLPMARMAGEEGKVFCIDVQKRMLDSLDRRSIKAGLAGIIETRLSDGKSFAIDDLSGSIDFALLFSVVHEVPDQVHLLREVYNALRPGGTLLVSEPAGHVKRIRFSEILVDAEKTGFAILEEPEITKQHSVLLLR